MTIHDLPTPSVLIDVVRLERNIQRMQAHCDRHGVELWPHIKTHKCGAILKRQLAAGAKGITCAKIGEAEALLSTGVRQIFIAHALVDPRMAPRLRCLADHLDRLILAATSPTQARYLERVVAATGLRLPVLAALDTGLGREGCRSLAELKEMMLFLESSSHLEPMGIYTHEGHCNFSKGDNLADLVTGVHRALLQASDAVGVNYLLAPGCSASAFEIATRERINIIRPGAYCLGDMSLVRRLGTMAWDDVAITVLSSVVDKPEDQLALIDAGSKTFSGDKTPEGESGRDLANPEIAVSRVNEEHGYIIGPSAEALYIGDRYRFVPAHVCTTINQTDQLYAVEGETVLETWPVEARGKVW